jgi:aminopeptidase YwaD
MRKRFPAQLFLFVLLALLAPRAVGQAVATSSVNTSQPAPSAVPKVCERCIRAHEEFLASDAMQGRGSGTHDELVAATYVASELQQYGIDPAGDNGSYIQLVPTIQRKITSPPQLRITPPEGTAEPIAWDYGRDFLVGGLTQTEFSGPLQKIDANGVEHPKIVKGAVVLILGSDQNKTKQLAYSLASEGAAAILMLADDSDIKKFQDAGEQLPKLPDRLEKDSAEEKFNVLELNRAPFRTLERMPEGAMVQFEARSSEKKGSTWNVVGVLAGSATSLRHSAILFSAHLDHLGIGTPVDGDNIYNGADDDASGTTAVLEIARVLGQKHPRRTVIFALFGSEESGELGSTYFSDHPPLPLKRIAADLEFEMIGRPDPAVKGDTLWLTGWERSNFGPGLAAHGARLVADPHPGENFFARSDNFALAKKGVVAQTMSSYGLHADYHQPSDDLAHLDFKHMDAAIGSLLPPVEWLVNSSFRPKWNVKGQPYTAISTQPRLRVRGKKVR